LDPAVALFRRLGYACAVGNGSRHLQLDEPEANLSYLLIRSSDVPVYVEYGAAALGIVGQDVLRESGRDVYEPLQLDFGQCRLVVAGTPEQIDRDLRLDSSVRVATKYPRLARAHFLRQGISAEIIHLTGSVELAPRMGLADLVVDVVETGRTLRDNGLVELEEVMCCRATVIVNRVIHRLRLQEIRALLEALETC
jgi:ATP phosphoribosyltransferase